MKRAISNPFGQDSPILENPGQSLMNTSHQRRLAFSRSKTRLSELLNRISGAITKAISAQLLQIVVKVLCFMVPLSVCEL